MGLGSELTGAIPGSIATGADATPATNYTIGTGLTLTGSTVSNDLITGKAGGQSAVGGTAASESLTLKSTTNATKGKIYLGAANLSFYDENIEQTGGSAVTDTLFRLGMKAGATLCVMDFAIGGVRQAAILANTFGTLELSGAAYIFTIGNFATYVQVVTANGNVQMGGAGAGLPGDNPSSNLQVQSVKTLASSAGATWDGVQIYAGTLTLTGTTTVTELAATRFQRPTITDASAVTVSDASTVIIDGEPIAAGSVTIGTAAANAKSLWIKRGRVQFDAAVSLGLQGTQANVVLDTSGGNAYSPGATQRFAWNNTGIGFYTTAPVAKPTVTGSKAANAALTSLMTALSNLGLVTDSTT